MDLLTSFPMEMVEVLAEPDNVIALIYSSAFNLLTVFRVKNVLSYARNIQHVNNNFEIKIKKFEIN